MESQANGQVLVTTIFLILLMMRAIIFLPKNIDDFYLRKPKFWFIFTLKTQNVNLKTTISTNFEPKTKNVEIFDLKNNKNKR